MKQRDDLRPTRLVDYLGQEEIKELLTVSMDAAKKRDQPLDHVLLNGPPGLGKTTLANIIANEMGWKFQTVVGPTFSSVPKVETYLILLKARTILFIDEIHRLRRPIQETLYPVLEDNKLSLLSGKDLRLNPLTIIGATTAIGKLEQPFIDRFGLYFQLRFYTPDELAKILEASSKRLRMRDPDARALEEIARRARGTPRIANTYLKRIRDYAEYQDRPIDQKFVQDILCGKLKVDELGLRELDRRYLQILAKAPQGIGLDALAMELREEPDTVEGMIEPYLLEIGFIERRRNGRWITEAGLEYTAKIKRKSLRLAK